MLRRIPFLEVLPVVLALLLFKEQFPFSHFPMYAALDGKARAVYITDEQGNLLPTRTTFGYSAAGCRKFLKTHAKKIQLENPAMPTPDVDQLVGKALLKFLIERLDAKQRQLLVDKSIVLHVETIVFTNGKFQKRPALTVAAVVPP